MFDCWVTGLTFTLNGQLLDASALSTAVVGGQGESLDAAAGTDTAGQHVVGVQVITTLRDEGRTEKHNRHISISLFVSNITPKVMNGF